MAQKVRVVGGIRDERRDGGIEGSERQNKTSQERARPDDARQTRGGVGGQRQPRAPSECSEAIKSRWPSPASSRFGGLVEEQRTRRGTGHSNSQGGTQSQRWEAARLDEVTGYVPPPAESPPNDDGCARAPRVFWCALTRTQSVQGSKAGREEPKVGKIRTKNLVRGLWNQDKWPTIKKSNHGTHSLRNGGGRKDAVGPSELPRREGRIR